GCFSFASACSAFVSACLAFASLEAVAGLFDRPRPPRLPRRRRGFVVVLGCPASGAGSGVTGWGASRGAAAETGACSSRFFLRNKRKRNLLRARALQLRLRTRRRGACAASCGLNGTSD